MPSIGYAILPTMAGNKAGGLRTHQTILERHGEGFYQRIGAMGGRVRSPTKGFGGNRERARAAGKKGGVISRRRKANSAN